MAVTWIYGGDLEINSTQRVTFYMASTPTAVSYSKNGAAFGGSLTTTQIGTDSMYYVDLTSTITDTEGPLILKITNTTDTIYLQYRIIPQSKTIASSIPAGSTYTHTQSIFEVDPAILPPSGYDDTYQHSYVVWTKTASGILEKSGPFVVLESRPADTPPVIHVSTMPIAPDNGDQFIIIRQ